MRVCLLVMPEAEITRLIPVDLLVWTEKSSQGLNPTQTTRHAKNIYVQVTLYIVSI